MIYGRSRTRLQPKTATAPTLCTVGREWERRDSDGRGHWRVVLQLQASQKISLLWSDDPNISPSLTQKSL